MSDPKGLSFNCAKYGLISYYVIVCIGCLIFIIMGLFVASLSDFKFDGQTDQKSNTTVKEELSPEETEKVIKIVAYLMILAAVIAILISALGVYAVYKEIYKLNLWMAILSVIGLIIIPFSGQGIKGVAVSVLVTACQVYYTIRLRRLQNYSLDDNNPESGKVKPNENTAIVMKAYQE